MKTIVFVLLLALSLAANAVLYFRSNTTDHSSTSGLSLRPTSPTAAPIPASPQAKAKIDQEIAVLTTIREQLNANDLPSLIARLRAAGFSPAMIRALISARLNESYSVQRKALLSQQEELPFWKTKQRWSLDPKIMSAVRDLNRQQAQQLKELLGSDAYSANEEMQAYQHRQYGDIPPEKLEQMQSILSDYNDLRAEIYSVTNGLMLPEDRAKLALLEKEQRDDLAKMLTPEELEGYELRSSGTAQQLRSQLVAFNPTEAEFRALFNAQRALEDQFGPSNTMVGGEQWRQRQAAFLELAKTSLSPERLAEFKQVTDPSTLLLSRVVARLELPSSTVGDVVAVQQDIQQRASQVRANRDLSPEQRNAQLAALTTEATNRLTPILGGVRGFDAYKQYTGQWLQNLQARPAPAKK